MEIKMFPTTQSAEFTLIRDSAKYINWYDEKGNLDQICMVEFRRVVKEHRQLMLDGFRQGHPVMAKVILHIPHHTAVDLVKETIGVEAATAATIVRGLQ